MNIYGLTDRGLIREVNEDSIGITCLNNGITIALVCDGMGGAAGGKIASAIAEEVFTASMNAYASELDCSKIDSKKMKNAILDSVEAANSAIMARAREDLSLFGMGCTLNAIVLCEQKGKLYFANAGDSRLYMITSKEIKQLTKDHSYVQMLVDNKEISEEEAENHPQKNLITKALGIQNYADPDVSDVKLKKKGVTYFLLCSDGLHGMLDKNMLHRIAISDASVQEKVFTYIKLANEAGGHDNISAILLEINEEGVTK